MDTSEEKLYKVSDLQKMTKLPLSHQTMLRHIKAGNLKAVKIGKGIATRYYIDKKDFEDFISNITQGDEK
jgi:hypothetical protein